MLSETIFAQGAQYIGEICRYLLSAPQSPEDRSHNVEIMWGNGLRPNIWQQFTDRFGVKFIGEFYGATEGNSNVLNIDSKPGSVGFTSVLLPFVYPVSLIRVDEEGEPLRADSGLCVACRPGEHGEFIGKIVMGENSVLSKHDSHSLTPLIFQVILPGTSRVTFVRRPPAGRSSEMCSGRETCTSGKKSSLLPSPLICPV